MVTEMVKFIVLWLNYFHLTGEFTPPSVPEVSPLVQLWTLRDTAEWSLEPTFIHMKKTRQQRCCYSEQKWMYDWLLPITGKADTRFYS